MARWLRLGFGHPATAGGDGERGECIARRSDGGDGIVIGLSDIFRTVFGQSRFEDGSRCQKKRKGTPRKRPLVRG